MSIHSVAVIGANGTLGTVLLESLVNTKSFTITALIRSGSLFTPPYPASQVRVAHVDKSLSLPSLTEAFKGQDAVIACFRFSDPEAHIRVVEAASAAGVKLFIPADFGSIDADNKRAQELVPLYRHKVAARRRAEALAEQNPAFSWTGIVCGHFFEWGITEGFFHAYLDKQVAEVFDGGKHRASTTTLTRVGEAVIRILRRYPDETIRNRTLFIQSFCIDQNELVEALERATGAKWSKKDLDSEKFIAEKRVLAEAGDNDAIEDLVFVVGTLDADWTQRDDFSMDLLGFEDEDLDATVQRVVASS